VRSERMAKVSDRDLIQQADWSTLDDRSLGSPRRRYSGSAEAASTDEASTGASND
jgi:hypothetical protein